MEMEIADRRRSRLKEWFANKSLPEKEKSYLSQLINKHTSFGERAARRIETDYKMPPGYLDSEEKAIAGNSAVEQDTADSIVVSVFDARASAGLGTQLVEHDIVVGGITLTKAWVGWKLRGITNSRNLAVLSACGDSMAPTFADGDLLLLDTGVNDVRLDAIYVFVYQGEMYVKRLQRNLDGTLLMISDNHNLRPQTIDKHNDGFRVLGRVVWTWNGRQL